MSGDDEIQNTGASASQQPLLPAGLSLPKALIIEGNLAANWKKFKRTWDNYAVVARLNRFEEEFKTATFLSCIGEDALEIFEGLLRLPFRRGSKKTRRCDHEISRFLFRRNQRNVRKICF